MKRYFFVPDPVKVVVNDAPDVSKQINFHPSDKKLGSRTIKTGKVFYISKSDFDQLKVGDVFRLKDLFNIKVSKKDKQIIGE